MYYRIHMKVLDALFPIEYDSMMANLSESPILAALDSTPVNSTFAPTISLGSEYSPTLKG